MARLRPQVRIPLGEEIISAKELICYGPYSAIDYDMAPPKWLPEKQVMSPYDHVQISHTIVPKIGTMQFVYNSTIYLSCYTITVYSRFNEEAVTYTEKPQGFQGGGKNGLS